MFFLNTQPTIVTDQPPPTCSSSEFPVLKFASPPPTPPSPKKKLQMQKGTHTKFYWGKYLQGQVEEGGVTGWGRLQVQGRQGDTEGPCTHPNPRKGRRAAGAQEDGLGKDNNGE